MSFYRKRSDGRFLEQVTTPASDRGYLIGVSLTQGHSRRIFHGGKHSTAHDFGQQDVYVRSFSHDYQADLRGAFDFLLLEIPRTAFERAVDERQGRRVRGLECVTGLRDPVLAHLAAAVLPALERPQQASALFVEQMGLVMQTYLIEQYGGVLSQGTPRKRHVLSRVNEQRAKDMLSSQDVAQASIDAVATACKLSRGHFIRAFRDTTGMTPYQWVLSQRIERAQTLLLTSRLSLAEVADACGFADQSHLSRVFSQLKGLPPGAWLRGQSQG